MCCSSGGGSSLGISSFKEKDSQNECLVFIILFSLDSLHTQKSRDLVVVFLHTYAKVVHFLKMNRRGNLAENSSSIFEVNFVVLKHPSRTKSEGLGWLYMLRFPLYRKKKPVTWIRCMVMQFPQPLLEVSKGWPFFWLPFPTLPHYVIFCIFKTWFTWQDVSVVHNL